MFGENSTPMTLSSFMQSYVRIGLVDDASPLGLYEVNGVKKFRTKTVSGTQRTP